MMQIFALDLVSKQYKKTHQANVFNLQPSIHKQGVNGENIWMEESDSFF